MDRPNWNAVGSMIGDLRQALQGIDEVQQRVLSVTGTAWSDDRMIKVLVGPRGQLMELEIDPRVYRTPNSKALAASILSTARRAVEQASEQARQILDRSVPSDLRVARIAGMDADEYLRRHDADLRPDPEDGDG